MARAGTDHDHQMELLKAVREKNLGRVKDLVSMNLINLKDNSYFDYSLVIKALDNRDIDIAKHLINKGFRVHKNSKSKNVRTVLHSAIELNNADLIKTLLAKGAFPDILTLDEHSRTPFHLAINKNQLSTIELFLSQFDAKTLDKKYLLHYAVVNDNIKVVLQLLEHNLSLYKKTGMGLTAFCIALKNKNLKILDCLLSHYKVQNVKPDDYNNLAPVYIAIIRGNLSVIKKYADSGLSKNIPLKLNTNAWLCLKIYTGFTLLHFAVKHIKLEIVEFLLKKGADILVKNKNRTPLHIAFETKENGIWKTWQDFHDNNSIIDLILEAYIKFNSNPANKHGLSHFHIACSRDEPKVVEHLLKLGAPINQPVKPQCILYKKFSPLHFAAKFRCKKTMEFLLKNGADVKQGDFKEMTALHIAAKESCLETVSLLLQYGADIASVDSQGKTPVHWAYETKNYRIIDLLLSAPNVANSNPTSREGISHFHIACMRNNVHVVKSFLENGVDLDSCVPAQSDIVNNSGFADCTGYSPLHFAVSHNRAKVVQLLLRSGVNVGIKSSKGFTPFHLACQYTHEMFHEFIENILCNLSKHRKITHQLQPLTDIVRIDEKHANKFSGSIGKLDWSPHRKDYLKIINSLLEYGSDVNCIDNNDNSTIFYAYDAVTKAQSTLENNLDCSKDLLDQIVKSLSEELYERRKFILDHLMDLDVNLNECFKHGSILNCVSINYEKDNESVEMMKLFLKKGANVNVQNKEMMTPLLQAANDGRNRLVSMLLESGAVVDCIDPRDNSTPLMLATYRTQYYSHNGVIRILINGGANPNARKSNGFTGLHVACDRKHGFALQLFLEHGADVNIEDNAGRSACCYLYDKYLKNVPARERRNSVLWMMEVLQKHIIMMNAIGLPISEKVLSSNSKFDSLQPLNEQEKKELTEKYRTEVQELRDTKINDNYTLRDVIFKDENSLSQLVKNPAFEAIVKSESFKEKYPNYRYFVELNYRKGVDRGNLLPEAKVLLSKLTGMHLPETCSENICKYFNNAELKESSEILRGILDSNVDTSDDQPLTSCKTHKRQRVN